MTDTGKSRLAFLLALILLGALYAVPKIVEGYRQGLAKGVEIREQQGR